MSFRIRTQVPCVCVPTVLHMELCTAMHYPLYKHAQCEYGIITQHIIIGKLFGVYTYT